MLVKQSTQAPMTPPAVQGQCTSIAAALALLTIGGASPEQIEELRLRLVFGAIFEGVRQVASQYDPGLTLLMETLHQGALRTAGTISTTDVSGHVVQAEPGHYVWCTDCTPSTNAPEGSGLIDHTGATARLQTPDGMTFEGATYILTAGIAVDEGFVAENGSEIVIDCGGNVLFFDVDTAPAMLASLKAFTAQFETMVAQLPAERQS